MEQNKATNMLLAVLLIAFSIAFGTFGEVGAKYKPPKHVIPCPNAEVDSSGVIQEALETAEQWETVSLEACTYYLAKAIVVDTAFHGVLRGAGKDRTVLKILPGHQIDGILSSQWADGKLASTLFYFDIPVGQSGDITVSDFSIIITDPEPAGYQDDQDWWQHALYNIFLIGGTDVNTRFERLRLVASRGNFWGWYNVAHAFHIMGYFDDYMKGNHTISDVDFENMVVTYNIFRQGDSRISVTNNTFTNALYGPYIWDCSNCRVEVTSNKIAHLGGPYDGIGVIIIQGSEKAPEEPSSFLVAGNYIEVNGDFDPMGVLVSQGGWETPAPAAPSKVTVTHNDIHTPGDGMILEDLDYLLHGIGTLKALVSSNHITMDGAWGGIQLIHGQGAVITNNRITGTGDAGIYMGAVGDFVDSCIVKGNNVNHIVANVAPIWLGEGTSNCIVIGGKTKTDVLDQGIGNILIGVNKMPEANNMLDAARKLGIQSAMNRLIELRKTMPR